jgi:hypothetical protein
MTSKIWWLPGPLIAISLVSFSIIGRGGPGFFFWSLLVGGLFLFVAPLVQVLLLRSIVYEDRPAAACFAAIGIVLGLSILALFSGIFSFW